MTPSPYPSPLRGEGRVRGFRIWVNLACLHEAAPAEAGAWDLVLPYSYALCPLFTRDLTFQ